MMAIFSSPAPSVSDAAAEEIARRHFNVAGRVQCLTSERDTNFLIRSPSGSGFVLKFTNPAEPSDVTDLQTRALLHVAEAAPKFPVQRLRPTVAGDPQIDFTLDDGRTSVVRMLTFLEGDLLSTVGRSSPQRKSIAAAAAGLGKALRGFFHAAAGYELLWDLKHAPRLLELLDKIEPDRRPAVKACLDSFSKHVTPMLPRLRGQIVHNDFNPYNILLSATNHGEVSGILDFGDVVHTALVCDLSVAAAYQLVDDSHPLEPVGEFVAAYHSVVPLESDEIEIIFDLVLSRLAITQLITGWRADLYPENRTYILRNNRPTWVAMQRFAGISRNEAADYLHRACNGMKPS